MNLEKYSSIPATRAALATMRGETSIVRLSGKIATFPARVNSSTGATTGPLRKITTLRKKFTHVNAATDLVLKSAFDTAADAHQNAMAVIANLLAVNVSTPLALLPVATSVGTVTTPGTIPAQTKLLAGSEGLTAIALSRAGANTHFEHVRNGLATLVKAYNNAALAMSGLDDTLKPITLKGDGVIIANLAIPAKPSTGAAIANTGDAAPKVWVDENLLAIADNFSFLFTKVGALLTSATAHQVTFPA